MEINGLSPSTSTLGKTGSVPDTNASTQKASFGKFLKRAISEMNQLHQKANSAANQVASGQEVDIHNTIIAMEKADVSFQLMMQVRNKALEAYQEVMRMQV